MYGEVRTIEQISPAMLRIVLGGGDLDEYETTDATDAYINGRFLPKGAEYAVPFEPDDLEDVPTDLRPRPRRITVRRWDSEAEELTIDFVVHGDVGYAGAWAQRTTTGDRLQFTGPGGSYRPSPDVDWHLMIGDETALPAIGASLDILEPDQRAVVIAVVDAPGYEIELSTDASVDIHWLYRSESHDIDALLPEAVREFDFPSGTFDVFLHGEAGEVRAVRKFLISERGVDPEAASISPYWRRTFTDEEWRAIKREWIAEQAKDI